MLISINQFDNKILVLKPICDAVRRYEIEQIRHYIIISTNDTQ